MKLDFTRVDILKCLIISRPWISRKAIISVTRFPEYFIDKSISKMKSDGLISVSRKFNNSYYYPRAMLLNNFSSTREMMEYLGISEPGMSTSRRKTDNAIFDQCKSSPHQRRIMWFYGKHPFPGFEQLP